METRFPKLPRPAVVPKPSPETKVDSSAVVSVTPATTPPPAKTEFSGAQVHASVEKAAPGGHVVPLSTRAKADPLIGAKETKGPSVSERIATPTRPPGYSPRAIWQEVVVMGTGHDEARALIGDTGALSKLKGIGFDLPVATQWRDFFTGIDRVSSERGTPNPSARGRAEFADWVVVQLGGQSSGLWKGAAA